MSYLIPPNLLTLQSFNDHGSESDYSELWFHVEEEDEEEETAVDPMLEQMEALQNCARFSINQSQRTIADLILKMANSLIVKGYRVTYTQGLKQITREPLKLVVFDTLSERCVFLKRGRYHNHFALCTPGTAGLKDEPVEMDMMVVAYSEFQLIGKEPCDTNPLLFADKQAAKFYFKHGPLEVENLGRDFKISGSNGWLLQGRGFVVGPVEPSTGIRWDALKGIDGHKPVQVCLTWEGRGPGQLQNFGKPRVLLSSKPIYGPFKCPPPFLSPSFNARHFSKPQAAMIEPRRSPRIASGRRNYRELSSEPESSNDEDVISESSSSTAILSTTKAIEGLSVSQRSEYLSDKDFVMNDYIEDEEEEEVARIPQKADAALKVEARIMDLIDFDWSSKSERDKGDHIFYESRSPSVVTRQFNKIWSDGLKSFPMWKAPDDIKFHFLTTVRWDALIELRSTCRDFYRFLTVERIWQDARKAELPSELDFIQLPFNIKEWQLATIVRSPTGHLCRSDVCIYLEAENRPAVNLWNFGRRLCVACHRPYILDSREAGKLVRQKLSKEDGWTKAQRTAIIDQIPLHFVRQLGYFAEKRELYDLIQAATEARLTSSVESFISGLPGWKQELQRASVLSEKFDKYVDKLRLRKSVWGTEDAYEIRKQNEAKCIASLKLLRKEIPQELWEADNVFRTLTSGGYVMNADEFLEHAPKIIFSVERTMQRPKKRTYRVPRSRASARH